MAGLDKELKVIAEEIDEQCFDFLNKNGYKIDKPYTLEKAIKIKEQLERDGKELLHKPIIDKVEFVDGKMVYTYNGIEFCLKEKNK